MSCNWYNVTKYLDRNPASRDTTHDKSRAHGRVIEKQFRYFNVPAYFINHIDQAAYPNLEMWPGRIVMQRNYTLPTPFRIFNAHDFLSQVSSPTQHLLAYANLVVRWRVGTTAYRYRLNNFQSTYNWTEPFITRAIPSSPPATVDTISPDNAFPCWGFPLYTNEVIQPNFCIELWTDIYYWTSIVQAFNADLPPQGLLDDFTFKTNLLYNPVDEQDVGDFHEPLESLTEFDVDNSIPENLPVDQPAGVQWLTN